MIYDLEVIYDERDNLEIWILEFDFEPEHRREPGCYETFFNSKLKGADRAFDSMMIEGFSSSYNAIIEEIKKKENSIKERYNVPKLNLYNVPLSEILQYIYQNFILEKIKGERVAVR